MLKLVPKSRIAPQASAPQANVRQSPSASKSTASFPALQPGWVFTTRPTPWEKAEKAKEDELQRMRQSEAQFARERSRKLLEECLRRAEIRARAASPQSVIRVRAAYTESPQRASVGTELERARIAWLRSETAKNKARSRSEAIELERDKIALSREKREEEQARSAATIAWCDRMLNVLHSPADMSVIDDWWND